MHQAPKLFVVIGHKKHSCFSSYFWTHFKCL